MRGLIILVILFITSCHIPGGKQFNPQAEVKFAEPKEVSEEVLPVFSPYVIRTRIVIEGALAKNINDLEADPEPLWSITPEKAMEQLKFTEELYADLGIKFYVSDITFRSYRTFHLGHMFDAVNYPNSLSIYYMLPNDFPFLGISSGPWEKMDTGILLAFGVADWVVVHEVGHWMGLLHTFNPFGDYVDDTPEQTEMACIKEEDDTPNCKNILSYCIHEPKFVTDGQTERMRRFLRGTRASYIVPPIAGDSIFERGLPSIETIDLFASKP